MSYYFKYNETIYCLMFKAIVLFGYFSLSKCQNLENIFDLFGWDHYGTTRRPTFDDQKWKPTCKRYNETEKKLELYGIHYDYLDPDFPPTRREKLRKSKLDDCYCHKCLERCGFDNRPLCGEDGKTYRNECHLRKCAAQIPPYIPVKAKCHGVCPCGSALVAENNCHCDTGCAKKVGFMRLGFYKECSRCDGGLKCPCSNINYLLKKSTETTEECIRKCPRKISHVCGIHGSSNSLLSFGVKTFLNECQLRCQKGDSIILSNEKCPEWGLWSSWSSWTSCHEMKCGTNEETSKRIRKRECEEAASTCFGKSEDLQKKPCQKHISPSPIRPHSHMALGSWKCPPGNTNAFNNDWTKCPEGEYVKAMQLKIESRQWWGGDDTALNAIRLYCSDGTLLTSCEGVWGKWRSSVSSKNSIVGIQLRSEKWQRGGDDTAANGVRFKDCHGRIYKPGDGYWGDWSKWVHCPNGTVITGFWTRVEARQGRGDDSALQTVRFYCDKLSSSKGRGS